jgi:taurine dioxygenase
VTAAKSAIDEEMAMISVQPSGQILGATIAGADLSKPLRDDDVRTIRLALGQYGVVSFPDQDIDPAGIRAFMARFGHPKMSAEWTLPDVPEVSVLSNILVDGRNIGYVDGGMSWHKDMTALEKPGFATMLYAIKVPRRNARSLGATHFANARQAYDDLPEDTKDRLEGAQGVNSGEYYNHLVRSIGGTRTAYAEKTNRRAPRLHPLVMIHPVTGQKVLYCDPGHVASIQGWLVEESDDMLAFLREHQLQPKYEYAYEWSERDVLMWDNLGTLHRATMDYRADEHRLMHRCMVSQPDDLSNPKFV